MTQSVSTKKPVEKMLRICLLLLGVTGIISGLCALGGETLELTPEASTIDAVTGDIVEHDIYTHSKIFFALLCSLAVPLLWLLAIRKTKHLTMQNPAFPVLFFIIFLVFFFLKPEVIPGGETTRYRYYAYMLYSKRIVWAPMDPENHFESRSKYQTYLEYKDPQGYMKVDNIKNAYRCERTRETVFLTLFISELWFPNKYTNIMDANCTQIKDINSLSKDMISDAHWFPM